MKRRPSPPADEDVWAADDDAIDARDVYVGIDLGTSNSAIAVWQTGSSRVKVIRARDADESRTVPSVARFPHDGAPPLAGHAAARAADDGASTRVRCAKRVIGRRFDDATVARLLASLPFECVRGADGASAAVRLGGRGEHASCSPVDCAAAVLRELRLQAEAYVAGLPRSRAQARAEKYGPGARAPRVARCVVGVPAHFNEAQRAATRAAAALAGFDGRAVTLTESSAAAMA